MKIKLKTEISEDIKDTEIIIKTNKLTDEIQSVIDILQNFDTYLNNIIATQNNDIFIINVEDIICLYSENKNNYCRTINGTYKIKYTLSELENKLSPKNFIRISNSCIANFKQVECFNNEIVGTIKIKYKDGNVDYVSRRRIKDVMQALKGGI